MQNVHLPSFYLGVSEEMESNRGFSKHASMELDSMPMNENILPNIDKQTKWRYVRTKDGLKLTDGNLTYGFNMPDGFTEADSRVSRADDDNILNFENDAVSKGTAQIHRSSPDNLYMTLADGAQNPTFMLQHEGGKQWRYSPAKKFLAKLQALAKDKPVEEVSSTGEAVNQEDILDHEAQENMTLIDPESLMKGASAELAKMAFSPSGFFDSNSAAEALTSGVTGLGNLAKGGLMWGAAHPITAMAAKYFGSKGAQNIRAKIDPRGYGLRRIADPRQRTADQLWPAAAAFIPTVAAGALMH